MSNYTRSISQLKTFTKCGERFLLERIHRAQMPARPAPWTIMGVAVHGAIMEWEKASRQIDVLELYYEMYDEQVEGAWQEQPAERYWFLPPMAKNVSKSLASYRERGYEQLEVYLETVEKAPWVLEKIEEPFEIDLDGIVVRGAVDRLLYYPGSDLYVVEDLKTGSPQDEDDARQLGFYALVARELWDIPVTKGQYWFTKLNRSSPEVDLERFDFNFWAETFKILDSSIDQGLFLPNPGKQCGLCSVRPWCSTQGWRSIGEPL